MLPSWIITAFLVFSAGYLFMRWKLRRLHAFAAKLNGPPDYPLVGSAFIFAGTKMCDVIPVGKAMRQKYGTLYTAWMGPKLILTTSAPDVVETILNAPGCLEKGFMYRFFECLTGLMTAPVEVWKQHRKLLNPTFNSKILRSFIPIFNEKTMILRSKFEALAGQGEFSLYEHMSRCTLDIICATTLGTNLNYQVNVKEGDIVTNGYETFLRSIMLRSFNPLYHFDFIYKRTKLYQKGLISRNNAAELGVKIIKLKKENMQNDAKMIENDDDEYRKPQIFVDQLFRLSKVSSVFDEAAITDEIDTMFTSGYETTALTISHTLLLLAIHQDIQDKVVAELEEVFYDADEPADFDMLQKLVYTEMVIKESMRLYPVGPVILRTTTTDVPLPTRNLVIPKGVTIIIPIFIMQRDEEIWGPEAHLFNPENFSAENVAKRHPCSFIPFSYGQRNCFGKAYAMMSLKIMLANILRVYRFKTKFTMDTVKEKFSVTMKLNHKHLVSVERRESQS